MASGAVVGKARVVLETDSRKMDRGLDQAERDFRGRGQRLGAIATKAGLVMGAGLAVGANKAIDAASNLNEQVNKTAVVFRGSEQDILKWSKTTAEAYGISRRAALEYAGVFGNMLVPMGIARKEAAGMSKEIVQLAADMASFNNASPEETLDALRAGLAGETEPLRRFGIFLNQDRIEAEALSSGLAKAAVDVDKVRAAQIRAELAAKRYADAVREHGKASKEAKSAEASMITSQGTLQKALGGSKVELTAAQKALATYQIIMKDTKDSQGDFGRTSDSLANRQRILRAQVEDTAAQLGQNLLPAAQKVMGVLVQMTSWAQRHSTATKITLGVVGALTAAVITYTAVNRAATFALTLFTGAQNRANIAMRANLIGLIVTALIGLGIALVAAYRKSETFRNVVNGVFKAVWTAVRTYLGFILKLVSGFLHGLEMIMRAASHIPGIGGKFRAAAEGIKTARERVDELRERLAGVKGKELTVRVRFAFHGGGRVLEGEGIAGMDIALGAAAQGAMSSAQAGLGGANRGGLSPWVRDELAMASAFGLRLTSGLRPGAVTSTGRRSLHASGQAIDVAGAPWAMANYARAVAGRSGVAEVIYTPVGAWYPGAGWTRPSGSVAADHYDHVHVGVRSGDGLIGDSDGRKPRKALRNFRPPRKRAARRAARRFRPVEDVVRGTRRAIGLRPDPPDFIDPVIPETAEPPEPPERPDLALLPPELEEAIFDAEGTPGIDDDLGALGAALAHFQSVLPLAQDSGERLGVKRRIREYDTAIKELKGEDEASKQEAAAAALAQLVGFMGHRQRFFSDYAPNIFQPGRGPGSVPLGAGAGTATGGMTVINQHFTRPPEDPFVWLRKSQFAAGR